MWRKHKLSMDPKGTGFFSWKKEGKNGWKLREKAIVSGMLLAVLFSFSGFAGACQQLPENIVRLHVLANSDSAEDQALKLQVRDHILKQVSPLMKGVSNKEEALEKLQASLGELQQAAEEKIRQQGYSYSVRVETEQVYFPTRTYGDVTLPAGKYDALRVVIGKGEGQNWWCMLFPALCLPAAEDTPEMEEVLSPGEMDAVHTSGYELRFKIWEIYEWVRENWFS